MKAVSILRATRAALVGGVLGGAAGGAAGGIIAQFFAGPGTEIPLLWFAAIIGSIVGGVFSAVLTHSKLCQAASSDSTGKA